MYIYKYTHISNTYILHVFYNIHVLLIYYNIHIDR